MQSFETYWGNGLSLKEKKKMIWMLTERYNVNTTYPKFFLSGQALDIFNIAVSDNVTGYVQNFVDTVAGLMLPEGIKSELKGEHITYTAYKRYISVKVDLYPYFGGAHPGHDILTITFDTYINTIMIFSDIFRADSNHLEKVSALVEEALFEKYPELYFAFNNPTYREGFAPKEENFGHWALSDDGLIIFFPAYQVAPYAAGSLSVVIPYAAFTDIVI